MYGADIAEVLEIYPIFDQYTVQVVSDYPEDDTIAALKEPGHEMWAVVSIWESGSFSSQSMYSNVSANISYFLELDVWSANPITRDNVGRKMFDFLRKNPWAEPGRKVPWTIEGISTLGYASAPKGIYRRTFRLTLQEVLQ